MEKAPICSQEAEESLLGVLLMNENLIYQVIDVVIPDDFYYLKNQRIYQTYLEMFSNKFKIDIITLTARLEDKGWLMDVGGRTYLTQLFNYAITESNVIKYALIVKDKSLRRQLLKAQSENTEKIYELDENINRVVAEVQGNIFKINPVKTRSDNIRGIVKELEELQQEYAEKIMSGKKYIGLSTGLEDLDRMIDGLRPGHFWVIGAWHGTGKTSFALNIIHSLLEQDVPCSIVSLEMSQIDLTAKLIGVRNEVSSLKVIKGINTKEIHDKITEGKDFLRETNLEIHMEFDIEKIKMQIRKDVYLKGTRVVLVDYLQKITNEKMYDETPVVSRAAKDLANLAQELKITIICLSQISNAAQRGQGAGAGFKGSGTVEASADMAILLRRDKEEEKKDGGFQETVPIYIEITKNKFGLDGVLNYLLHLPSGKFIKKDAEKQTNEPQHEVSEVWGSSMGVNF